MGPSGYYSYDFGGWHFVVLNSECNAPGVGGCSEGSPQNNWLEADLAANSEVCTLAYWHRPAFFSKVNGNRTAGAASAVRPFWDDLQFAGAEIVLTGHSHWYERFRPQNSAGQNVSNGIVEWVVGTGGKSHNTNALAAPGFTPREQRHGQRIDVRRAEAHVEPDGIRVAVPDRGKQQLQRQRHRELPLTDRSEGRAQRATAAARA